MPRTGTRKRRTKRAEAEGEETGQGDPRLRSCNALMKYHVEASDGGMGHVQGHAAR
jgi:hypothetical protein